MSELEKTPVETLEIVPKQLPDLTKITDSDFFDKVRDQLNKEKIWRSSAGICEALKVDPLDFDKWARKNNNICSKGGKEDGVIYYALISRLEKEEQKVKVLVTEEDRYVVAELNVALQLLTKILKKHSLVIHGHCAESFAKIVDAKGKLEAGFLLFATTTKANLDKMS